MHHRQAPLRVSSPAVEGCWRQHSRGGGRHRASPRGAAKVVSCVSPWAGVVDSIEVTRSERERPARGLRGSVVRCGARVKRRVQLSFQAERSCLRTVREPCGSRRKTRHPVAFLAPPAARARTAAPSVGRTDGWSRTGYRVGARARPRTRDRRGARPRRREPARLARPGSPPVVRSASARSGPGHAPGSPLKKSFGAMTTASTPVRHLKASTNPPIRLRFQAPHRSGCWRPGIRSTSSTGSWDRAGEANLSGLRACAAVFTWTANDLTLVDRPTAGRCSRVRSSSPPSEIAAEAMHSSPLEFEAWTSPSPSC